MPRKILIVDDNMINRQMLSFTLCSEYDILEAADGAEAMALLNKHYKMLSAVLTDIVMPKMDGYELLRRIRENVVLSQIPVIMVTGTEDEDSRVKALSLGANDFIQKPFNPEIVRHCVKNNIALRETASILNAIQKDKLTGLYNREAFFERVAVMMRDREPGYYLLSSFDIDNFKLINDQYGAVEGDRILRVIGRTVIEDMEAVGGLAGRISGDNFAVLLPVKNSELSITRLIQQNRMAFSDKQAIVFSVGRYIITDLSLAPSAIYDRAYIAKQSVKGRYDEHIAYFDDAMLERLVRDQRISTDMDAALAEHQFEAWFQPQHNHFTKALVGAEALVRWRHPEKGLIPPGDFIPVFEENGFVYELDKYVWEETCRYLRKWTDEGRNPLPVSVNISRYDIFRADFIDVLTGLIEKYRIPVELLRLEVTESAFAKSTRMIVDIVRQLVDLGFTVEIDDFGSGYSSLNTLKSVPAQVVKLDMRFLEEDDDAGRGGNILESIVRMTKWLGMSVIAEGVETKEQADYLASVGCSYMQGYLYARPMCAADYEAYCRDAGKKERLLSMDTVDNLDNNAFWDPESMDTLIFNSFVGGACIYEYHKGNIELLRATENYTRVIGNTDMTVEDVLKLDLTAHLDEENKKRVAENIDISAKTHREVTGEYVFTDLPGCPHKTYLRSGMRVIAVAGDRYLVYCTNENITAQRQSEQHERDTAERMQAVMDNAGSGIAAMMIDGRKVEFLFANDRYYEIHGYTRAQFAAEVKDVYELFHHEDRQMVFDEAQKVNEFGRIKDLEYRILRRDGRVIWVKASISTRKFAGIEHPVQVIVVSDITAEKLAEEQLSAIMKNMSGGVTASIVNENGIRRLFANDRYYALMGYAREEYEAQFKGTPSSVLPEDQEMLMRRCREISETGRPGTVDFRVVRSDGKVRWITSSINLMDYPGETEPVQLAVMYDITEQLEAQREIRRLSEQLQAIMDNVDLGIIAAVVENGEAKYLFANSRYYEMLGYTKAQFEAEVGSPYLTVAPEDQARVREKTGEINVTGESALIIYNALTRGGERRCLRASISVAGMSGEGALVQYSILRDITDELASEKREHRATEQIQAMMDDMPGGFVRLRIGQGGRLTSEYFNNGMMTLTGMTRKELEALYNNDAMAGVHPDDISVANDVCAKMLADGEAHSARYRLRCGKRGYIWLSVVGRRSIGAAGETFLNIYYTDASGQVKDEETRSALLDNLPGGAGVYEYKNNQLAVLYLNKSYWELVGREAMGYAGMSAMGAVHPDDLPIVASELKLAIEQKRDMACDFRLRHETKDYHPVHLVGRIVPNGNDSHLIYVTFVPISDDAMSVQEMLGVALSAMMEYQTDYTFVKDKNLRYICCSREMARLIGRTPEEMQGKTDDEMFDKELAQSFVAEDRLVLEKGESILNSIDRLPAVDGSIKAASTSKFPLKDSAGNIVGIYGVGHDVTETRKIQSRLDMLTNNIPGGMAIYEGRPEAIDKIRLTYFSDGFCRLFGYTREEYGARAASNPLSLVASADIEKMKEHIAALVHSGVPLDYTYRAKMKGGKYKWINVRAVTGEPNGENLTVNAVFYDVTEQKEASEKLRVSEKVNRLAIQQSGNIVCQYDVAAKQLAISPNVSDIFEVAPIERDIPEKAIKDGVISPDTVDVYKAFYESIVRGDESGEVLFRRRSTLGWRWVREHFTTIFDDSGRPAIAVISFADVTESIEKDMAYQKWQQSIRDRAPESYSLYHCNISRNTIINASEGLLDPMKPTADPTNLAQRTALYAQQCVFAEDRESFLSVMNRGIQLMRFGQGKMTDALEYRELMPAGAPRWMRVTVDLVDSPSASEVEAYLLFENINEAKQAELEILARAETDPLTGLLNRKAFEERFEHLMKTQDQGMLSALFIIDLDGFKQVNDNFGHAIGDETLIEMGGKLRDAFRGKDLVCRLGGDEFMVFMGGISHISAIRERAALVCALLHKSFSLEVQLSASIGISISPDNGDDFETLYSRADAALYHVKRMGKDSYALYAESMSEKPAAAEENAEAAKPEPLPRIAPKRRMLIVEDNEINRDYLSALFEDEFIIDTAAEGTAALVRLQRYGAGISIVLLDLMMPGVDGFAVLKKMRESLVMQSIPVIVVSGMNERETCLEAIREGASDYITKPVDAELLKLRVASALSKMENEQLRAQNRYLAMQNDEARRMAEAKRHSEELSLALREAERADIAKSQFLSSMSHEIRTPLNAVIGYNTIARSEMCEAKTDEQRRHSNMKVMDCLTKSEVASKHLLTIINDVLDMSAIEAGRMRADYAPFDFRSLITSLTVIFFSQARAKGVNFEVIFDKPTEEWFIGDQLRVNQILTNLLANAVKFTPENGSVTLKITEVAVDEKTAGFCFVVTDTGIGMTQEYLTHIWTPFEQAEASISRRFGGSGLGLSITKNLVELMKGTIDVESRSGEGSKFTVNLTFKRMQQPDRPISYDFSGVRALVADDDASTCDYIKLLFDRCGAVCSTFTSGKEAVKAFAAAKKRGAPFNMCLIDWRMPQMDGFTTISEIRRIAGKDLPIVVVTAYDFTEVSDHASRLGINRFISKPLFQSSLFDLLATISGKQAAAPERREMKYDFQGARVLLAEDNNMNMEVAKHILLSARIAVDCAWNGQEAIDIFMASRVGTYNAILMDVHMPEVDGYQATRMIRTSGHADADSIPIIAMTADVFAEDIAEARAAGMNDHIAKPIDVECLYKMLSAYMKGKNE